MGADNSLGRTSQIHTLIGQHLGLNFEILDDASIEAAFPWQASFSTT